MYYVLEAAPEHMVDGVFEEANPGHDIKWMVGQGMEPDEKPDELKILLDEPNEEYPDFFELVHTPFGSERFKKALAASGVDNVEFYPTPILDDSGKVVASTLAMNILGRIACMDKTKSQVTRLGKRIVRIKSLAIDDGAIHGCKMFRIHERPSLILVSRDVADAIRELVGVTLLPAEGWSDSHLF
jgi:hypothetical protein